MTERLQRWLPVIDAILFAAAFLAAAWVDALACPHLAVTELPWPGLLLALPGAVLLKLLCFRLARVYRVYWACAGFRDAVKIGLGASAASAGLLLAVLLARLPAGPTPAAVLLDLALTLGMCGGLRFAERAFREFWPGLRRGRRAIIVGAGEAGQLVGRELRMATGSGMVPVCYLDDDPAKQGRSLHGIPVAGTVAELPAAIRRYGAAKVIIAVASAPRKLVQEVVEQARAAGAASRIVPRLGDILSGAATVSNVKEIDAQDLLGRERSTPDLELLRARYSGQCVMVTGAGGSIGSELCRQLAFLGPRRLVLLERNESNLYHLEQELREMKVPAPLAAVLGDICDRPCLDRAFAAHRPDAVLHAAAYKHVPLLEENAPEAVRNNVLGTRCLVEAAVRWRTERFVLVSTDKAVRPSSVMGCTKRVAELICRKAGEAAGGQTAFVTVRFGNVLDSDGSVVPLFRRQIARGGPVTVTHAEVTRYFMSIPEAAGLVLTAGAVGEGSRTYVLEMGSPVRIADLAREMIGLAGLVPGRDVEIVYTGLRPGEKLHEELWYAEEELAPTAHPGVLAARSENGVPEDLEACVAALDRACSNGAARAELTRELQRLVPEFHAASEACRGEPNMDAPAAPEAAATARAR